MAAPTKSQSSDITEKQDPLDDLGFHPNVNFLYKTMLQRDPRKRRVKPVADSLVQINFGGIDDDSEEDSDFDIGQHVHDSGADDEYHDDSDKSENLGGVDDEEDKKNVSTDEHFDDDGAYVKNNDEDEEEEMGTDDESEDNDESSEEDETDEDDSDEDMEEEDGRDNEDDGDAGPPSKTESPEIKGLEHVFNMIDSDEDDEDYVPRKKKKKSAAPAGEKPPPAAVKKSKIKSKKSKERPQASTAPEVSTAVVEESAPQARIKVIVCCVCLSDRSADDDEIVECDNCGISVHEGCYGISESHSLASTESSASTEPWFCDACKASATPVCELCPNTGGIFKETDNGKWVHIVCALYTPGVAFGDVDRLSLVTLFEMPYSKWGARECSLCEDSRFSQTGVCINCDAGMCKAYFHVTCAQREGLLADVTPEEVMEVADPFFAYCKLHADKMVSKIKRRNWLAIQSHVKTHTPSIIEDGAEKLRFQRKLRHHIDKYSLAKLKKPPSWVPDQKMVRHLHTSPSAVRGFLKKAELMGIITQAQTVPVESQEMRKKAQGQPAFTADFITYFMERNMKLENLKSSSTELSAQNKTLQNQERVVRKKYDKLAGEVKELQEKGAALRKDGESLCSLLQDLYGKAVPGLPEIFKTKKRARSPSKKETSNPESEVIHHCGICNKTTQQHLMVKCDSCKKHYHLGCLNPPLTRMPKKTKLFGWQCSFCALSSSDGSVKSAPDPDQPRKLRETIKEPDKYFHQTHIQQSLDSQRKKSLLNKKSRQKRQTARAKRIQQQKQQKQGSPRSTKSSPGSTPADTKSSASPKKLSGGIETGTVASQQASPSKGSTPGKDGGAVASQQVSPFKGSTPGKGGGAVASQLVSPSKSSTSGKESGGVEEALVLDIMCVVCNGYGTSSDTVRCDECMLSYHLACLDPPMKKSPKVRGYAWHCEACDMMDSSDDNSAVDRRKKEKPQQQDKKAQITLASGREGREASNSILFDIDDSSDG